MKRRNSVGLTRITFLLGVLFARASLFGADAAKPATTNAAPAQATKEAKEAELLKIFKKEQNITNTLGMVMVWLPKGYRVATYEVTQSQYEEIMGENPSRFQGSLHPVERVSWNDAIQFCRKLTEKELKDGKLAKGYAYALPSEDQWEFLVDEANLKDGITSHLGDRRNTENVGGLGPNKYGLHDVRGNVWEWCSTPVARGGSWRSNEDYLELAFRYAGTPDLRYDDIGFRVILQGGQ